jgi:hypothetical protein
MYTHTRTHAHTRTHVYNNMKLGVGDVCVCVCVCVRVCVCVCVCGHWFARVRVYTRTRQPSKRRCQRVERNEIPERGRQSAQGPGKAVLALLPRPSCDGHCGVSGPIQRGTQACAKHELGQGSAGVELWVLIRRRGVLDTISLGGASIGAPGVSCLYKNFGYTFSTVLYIVALSSEYTRALTFPNLRQALMSLPLRLRLPATPDIQPVWDHYRLAGETDISADKGYLAVRRYLCIPGGAEMGS